MAAMGRGYLRRFPGFWLYPLRYAAPMIFLVLVPPAIGFCRIINALPWSDAGLRWPKLQAAAVVFLGVAVGYAALYLFEILSHSAIGKDRPPDLLDGFEDEPWRHLLYIASVHAASFLPAGVAVVYAADRHPELLQSGVYLGIVGGLVLLGIIYLPIAFILVAFTERIRNAFDIRYVVEGIRRMAPEYLFCCLVFGIAIGFTLVCEWTWIRHTPSGLNTARFISVWLTSLGQAYVMMCAMRALGVLFYLHKDRLGWWR